MRRLVRSSPVGRGGWHLGPMAVQEEAEEDDSYRWGGGRPNGALDNLTPCVPEEPAVLHKEKKERGCAPLRPSVHRGHGVGWLASRRKRGIRRGRATITGVWG